MEHKKIPIDKIRINEKNVKKPPLDLSVNQQLANSIKSIGLIELIVVSYDKKTDDYVVVDGNRRLLALRQLNEDGEFDEVDCVILTADEVEEYFLAKTVEQYARGGKLERMPEIPLDEIDYHCDSESRAKDIDELMEHIRKNGLLEPIVVCKSDDEKYAILVGHRRYCAYVVLNKNHPGEGWDKIPARSRGDCGGIEVDANPSDSNDSPTIDAK